MNVDVGLGFLLVGMKIGSDGQLFAVAACLIIFDGLVLDTILSSVKRKDRTVHFAVEE